MIPEADGVLIEVFASAGTSLRNHMWVETLDDTTSLVKEHTTVKVSTKHALRSTQDTNT
jgi:hypothetical protein